MACLAVVLLIPACVAHAQTGQDKGVGDLAWFEREWKKAQDWPIPSYTKVTYDIEGFVEPQPDEVARLAKLIEGKPEHPERRRYKQLLQELEWGGSVTSTYTLWYANGQWRWNRDTPDFRDFPFDDVVLTDTTSWSLERDNLCIVDPRRAPEEMEIVRYEPGIRTHLSEIIWGGFGGGAKTEVGFQPSEATLHPDGRWIGRVTSRNGMRIEEYRGHYDPTLCRIIVDETEIIRSDDNEIYLGIRHVFSEWRFNDYLNRPVAHRIEKYVADGTLKWRLVLKEIEPFPHSLFATLTKVPDLEHGDAIRGEIKPDNIMDVRPAKQSITYIHNGKYVTESNPIEIPPARGGLLRYVGWSVASLAVAGIVVLYARKYFARW
jgi:hypothetical protein